MSRGSSSSMLVRMAGSSLVVSAILSFWGIIASNSNSTWFVAAQQDGPLCSCSPSKYTFTLDFSLTCPPVNVTRNGGISATFCQISPFGDANSNITDLVPVEVGYIDILELSQDFEVLTQDNITSPDPTFKDGDTIEYTSIVNTMNVDNAADEQKIPKVIQLNIFARNAAGQPVVNFYAIAFSNDCDEYPTLIEGESAGWTRFTKLEPPSADFCPAASLPTSNPEPIDPAPSPTSLQSEEPTDETTTLSPTMSPTKSPTAPPTSATESPSSSHTDSPTNSPTGSPTGSPKESDAPSSEPTESEDTDTPSAAPTDVVSTMSPTKSPTTPPTSATESPSSSHTDSPTNSPTGFPTGSPKESDAPSSEPTETEDTDTPSAAPTDVDPMPAGGDASSEPTDEPTTVPLPDPTPAPVPDPTDAPLPDPTPEPSMAPTPEPTVTPTPEPTQAPFPDPTDAPEPEPTPAPIPDPTPMPSLRPTKRPTKLPTPAPTASKTDAPTSEITMPPPSMSMSMSMNLMDTMMRTAGGRWNEIQYEAYDLRLSDLSDFGIALTNKKVGSSLRNVFADRNAMNKWENGEQDATIDLADSATTTSTSENNNNNNDGEAGASNESVSEFGKTPSEATEEENNDETNTVDDILASYRMVDMFVMSMSMSMPTDTTMPAPKLRAAPLITGETKHSKKSKLPKIEKASYKWEKKEHHGSKKESKTTKKYSYETGYSKDSKESKSKLSKIEKASYKWEKKSPKYEKVLKSEKSFKSKEAKYAKRYLNVTKGRLNVPEDPLNVAEDILNCHTQECFHAWVEQQLIELDRDETKSEEPVFTVPEPTGKKTGRRRRRLRIHRVG